MSEEVRGILEKVRRKSQEDRGSSSLFRGSSWLSQEVLDILEKVCRSQRKSVEFSRMSVKVRGIPEKVRGSSSKSSVVQGSQESPWKSEEVRVIFEEVLGSPRKFGSEEAKELLLEKVRRSLRVSTRLESRVSNTKRCRRFFRKSWGIIRHIYEWSVVYYAQAPHIKYR